MKKLLLLLLLTISYTSSVYADVFLTDQPSRALPFLLFYDPEAAYKEWKPLAEQGDAYAQDLLGYLYNCGIGVPQDYEQANYWWTKAAEQGFAKAQYDLEAMYNSVFCGLQLLETVDF